METLFDVFFNGHVIGLLLGLPLLASPARGSDGALVKRSSGVEPSRVLDLFAGIGIGGSPFGPFESREVVSVELDLAPATSLAKTTKRTLRTPGLTADPIDAGGQVLHADVRDPTWYFLSLEAPFTDVLWSAPGQHSTLLCSGKYDGSCLPGWTAHTTCFGVDPSVCATKVYWRKCARFD